MKYNLPCGIAVKIKCLRKYTSVHTCVMIMLLLILFEIYFVMVSGGFCYNLLYWRPVIDYGAGHYKTDGRRGREAGK